MRKNLACPSVFCSGFVRDTMDFIKFQRCSFSRNMYRPCLSKTDLCCCSCGKFICETHARHCIQCDEMACLSCWHDDQCCLQERRKTEKHLRKFYENKWLKKRSQGLNIMGVLNSCIDDKNSGDLIVPGLLVCFQIRLEAGKREVEHILENPELYIDVVTEVSLEGSEFFGQCFPAVAASNKKNMLAFLKAATGSKELFSDILLLSEYRESILDLVEDILREKDDLLLEVLKRSIEHDKGKALYVQLRKRDLLRYSEQLNQSVLYVEHLDGLKWLESNGVSFSQCLKKLQYATDPALFEYIMIEKGLDVMEMVESIGEYFELYHEALTTILKLKGAEAVRKIPAKNVCTTYTEIGILRSIGYDLESEDVKESIIYGHQVYAMLCFQCLSVEELSARQHHNWLEYERENDLKVCKAMMPFIRRERKKKMITFVMCVRRLYGKDVPKDLLWKILDYCYSPIEERGQINL